MVQYNETVCALLAIELQHTVPCKQEPEPSNTPVRGNERPDEACTGREKVMSYIHEHGEDYNGRSMTDVHITARLLAEVVGYSKETARRRLNYFEDVGVVEQAPIEDGYRNYYVLADDFTGLSDTNIRSESEIADAAKQLLSFATEE